MVVIYSISKKGFTIIELFIAVAVLAVVSAASIFYYNDYIDEARKAVRIANEKLVNDAISRYYTEHMAYPKYMWNDDSVEDLGKKVNRGLDSALSNYFIDKKVSDILLEGSGVNPYDVFFLVSEPAKKSSSGFIDNSMTTTNWKMAKNLRFASRDFLVHKVRIVEADSGIIETSTFNNHESFSFPLVENSVVADDTVEGYNTIVSDEDLDIKMVAIPPGTFIMGSPTDELGRFQNEGQHQVTISKQFLMSKYEITQKQFLKVMGYNNSTNKTLKANFPDEVVEDFPVETVSWTEAKALCEKLNTDYSRLLPYGYKFDLPTEAQWEYACRAGTTTSLNNGKNITAKTGGCANLNEIAWYKGNSWTTTHQVGKKAPNAWGLYDMIGNVNEFCLDKRGDWRIDYSPDPVTDPISTTGHEYIIRGGNYLSDPERNRSAYRDGKGAGSKERFVGIRLVLVQTDED